jgi:phosphoserine phosphatase RsbU/P
MAVLRELTGDREFPLRGKIILLGRDPACDIVVNTDRTSWRHALIFHSGLGYAVEDLDSVNGTYLNGKRIVQRTPLHPLDRLEISGLHVTFYEEPPPKAGVGPTRLENGQAESGAGREGDVAPASPRAASEGVPGLKLPSNFSATEEDADLAGILTSVEVGGAGRLEVRPEAKLHAILEISRALDNSLNLDGAFPRVLDRLFSIFPHADHGFILLRDLDTGQLVCKATRTRPPCPETELAISQGIVNHALTTGRAILSADASADDRFDPHLSIQRFRIGSIMCVPMIGQANERLGLLQIDTRDKRHPFCEEDLEVLVSATTQTARAVELARWHKEQSDMEAAIRIQKSFLPAQRPDYRDLRFFDYYSAARLIGGDYYDYIPLPGNRLAVALGDVSGKGVAAALLMARLSAAVRFSLATEPSLTEAVYCLNNVMRQADADRFVTFVVIVIDRTDFSLTMVNAGHPPPLLLAKAREGSSESVAEIGEANVGLPLGVFDQPYEETRLRMEVGDTLVLYTDGITEARNPGGDFYGLDRLLHTIREAPNQAEAIGEAILPDVRRFAGGRSQSDDLTVVCVTRER